MAYNTTDNMFNNRQFFAVMTMLTKNSFIDEINKLYAVTARAKDLVKIEFFIHMFLKMQ